MHNPSSQAVEYSRRNFLGDAAVGLAGIACLGLLARDGKLIAEDETQPRQVTPHFAPRVKHIIQIFLGGGLSQVDSFDYKPDLYRFHGSPMPNAGEIDVFNSSIGKLHQPHFAFKKRGQSGLWISDLFPHIAEVADELTIFRSMFAETGNHIPGIFQANTGFRQMGFPAMGSWLSHGLGSENDNLPAFVVLPDPGGIPNAAGGAFNWTSGFLPAHHQGVAFNTRNDQQPIQDLQPAGNENRQTQRARLTLLDQFNRRHLQEQAESDPLITRIRSYELAARMQDVVPEAANLGTETPFTQRLYGMDNNTSRDFARNCILARRLVERGVRMVQLWSGDGVAWDSHDDITSTGYKGHLGMARKVDQPIAGLIRDLRQRGLLDETLVILSTEFGRTPFAQAPRGQINRGRDHNQYAYTNVMAGGGLKAGFAYGETDPFGFRAMHNRVSIYDFHATILHLMGLDHERLTFYHNGIRRRLTNVHGHVVEEVLAG